MTTGMVLGKFLPPHLGHLYLIDFARSYVDDLTVVVGTLPSEPIKGQLRFDWMREIFDGTNARVVHLDKVLPQDPSEHPDFWRLWQTALKPIVPDPLDHVFASEDYGNKLAEVLGASFVSVDIERSILSVSGTAIRKKPLQHWQYLPRCVRPHFLKRVCIFGPESTGKSTLARELADHYQTIAVPEYARHVIEAQSGEIGLGDMMRIARGQAASEDALARSANRLLVCDTDVLTTTIWSDWLFDECPSDIRQLASQRTYDLYLLLDVDVPWVDDVVRYLPEDRRNFFTKCEQTLQNDHRPFKVLRGDWKQRKQSAITAIDQLLDS